MKILIAYDGSNCSETALDDLMQAGLPATGEFSVMSVAEVWLPPDHLKEEREADTPAAFLIEMNRKHDEKNKKVVAEFQTLATHAAGRLRRMFPKWTVTAEAVSGSPAWEVLMKADQFKPDVIVAGSHGRSAVGHFFLGSISNKILTEAHCSVRIARGRIDAEPSPVRVIIGFDASSGAQAAVEAVTARNWLAQSEVRLLAVTDPLTPSLIARFVPPIDDLIEEVNEDERARLHTLAEPILQKLKAAGLTADLSIQAGNPKKILVEAAERWCADAIFVGANSHASRIDRFLLGSVSAAIAARAHCTVEVVRTQQ